jgi:hypothetical protein
LAAELDLEAVRPRCARNVDDLREGGDRDVPTWPSKITTAYAVRPSLLICAVPPAA